MRQGRRMEAVPCVLSPTLLASPRRLADGAAHHLGGPPPAGAGRRVLVPVLPSLLLLPRALPVLPRPLLLPRGR